MLGINLSELCCRQKICIEYFLNTDDEPEPVCVQNEDGTGDKYWDLRYGGSYNLYITLDTDVSKAAIKKLSTDNCAFRFIHF